MPDDGTHEQDLASILGGDCITAADRALCESGINDHPVLGHTAVVIPLYSWGYDVYAETPGGEMKRMPRSDIESLDMKHFLAFRELAPTGQTVIIARDSDGIEVRFSERSRLHGVI